MTSSRPIRILRRLAPLAALALIVACQKATPPEKLEEAQSLLAEGQMARAVLKLKEITREHPEDPAAASAHIMLAQYYTREGNATKALEELEAVAASKDFTDPATLNAMDGIVSIRSQVGDFEGALAAIDELIAAMPESQARDRAMREVERASILLAWGAEDETRKAEGVATLSELMLESEDAYVRGTAREQVANYHRTMGDLEASNDIYRRYLDRYPEDTVRPRLEMAMGVNLKRMGEEDEAEKVFRPAAEQVLAEADSEPELARKTAILEEVAQMTEIFGDYQTTEELRRRIMAENPMSQIAINSQFRIASMWAMAGINEKDEELFKKGIAVLEQMTAENEGTNIGEAAQNTMTNALDMFEQVMNPPADEETEEPGHDEDGAEEGAASTDDDTDSAETETP